MTFIPSVFSNNLNIPLSTVVKNLGLYIDSTDWQAQATNVGQKVTSCLRALYGLKNFLPAKTRATLMQSLIIFLIDCSDVRYFDLVANLFNKLDRLLNSFIRFVYNLR